ncbi:M14 family zinc carboxypeptidase [Streptomyces sp. NBC_01565]|uniref:M14 family zinc carboxypeptidase n=1 Tax=unclassified Streptomyces TaxID=2593676 RepID=UPI00225B0208|nr:M14 family zinc carboxypeptidase [Streptomyces sp. NBC_01565]MCX4546748.1 M14 family zinc carboxypeptidase [Streptomyces sp. NBC_01565]
MATRGVSRRRMLGWMAAGGVAGTAAMGTRLAAAVPAAEVVIEPQFGDSYHGSEEIWSHLKTLAGNSDGVATEVNIGQTYEKRLIRGLSVKMPGVTPKNSFIVVGGQRAREWIGPAVCVEACTQFITQARTDSTIGKLLRTYEMVFVPIVNVDGYEYTRSTDRRWVKNRQPNSGSICTGTHLNSNFDSHWGSTSKDPCSEEYQGSAAFSAPESEAVARYVRAKGNVIVLLDVGGGGLSLSHPYAYDLTKLPANDDRQDKAGKKMVLAMSQIHGTSYSQGPAAKLGGRRFGTLPDWAYDSAKVRYPCELRVSREALTPSEQIRPTSEEVIAGVVSLGQSVKEMESL